MKTAPGKFFSGSKILAKKTFLYLTALFIFSNQHSSLAAWNDGRGHERADPAKMGR
ncbi:MAG: hypothetical protein ACR2H1_01325 [Limisphaerales bacterium]